MIKSNNMYWCIFPLWLNTFSNITCSCSCPWSELYGYSVLCCIVAASSGVERGELGMLLEELRRLTNAGYQTRNAHIKSMSSFPLKYLSTSFKTSLGKQIELLCVSFEKSSWKITWSQPISFWFFDYESKPCGDN